MPRPHALSPSTTVYTIHDRRRLQPEILELPRTIAAVVTANGTHDPPKRFQRIGESTRSFR